MQVSTMKTILLNKFLAVMIVASACSSAAVTQKNTNDESRRALEQRFAQIAAEAHGRVGVAARVLETDEEASLKPGEHFPMQSVYKLPIAMAVLRRIDAGELKLDQMVPVTKGDF